MLNLSVSVVFHPFRGCRQLALKPVRHREALELRPVSMCSDFGPRNARPLPCVQPQPARFDHLKVTNSVGGRGGVHAS